MIYRLPDIVIFKWSQDGMTTEQVRSFTSFEAAWDSFNNLKFCDFPNRIIFIEHEGRHFDKTHTMKWQGFIDAHRDLLRFSFSASDDAA